MDVRQRGGRLIAQTKKKRKRKHRGTPAGTIEARGRTGKGQIRSDAKNVARDRRQARYDEPPTWRGAFNRAAISAVIFAVFSVLVLKLSVAAAVPLAAVMVAVYLPLSYVTDRFFYNRRQRQKATRGGR
jgi:hypothetical protein